jgi:photosystem II stability/assembly factor-like uncharacterized protein
MTSYFKHSKQFLIPILSIFFWSSYHAQQFITNGSNKALTFKEIQLQFNSFKKANNLSKQKHWKQFKRYEADMQLHTNGRGEPDGFATYIEEAIKASENKTLSKSSAAVWSPVGPNAIPNNLTGYMENGIGRVNCVAFHPTNANVFYVGVAQGGIWKTTNGGSSYTPLTDNLPITRVSDICIDPNNTNVIYASICDFAYIDKGLYLDGRKRHTHYGLGVYKSTDAGLSWNPTGLTFQLTNGDASLLKEIIINPANSNELLACGVSGMYRSVNAGATWVKKLDSLFWDMVQDPINPSTIYAATGWLPNSAMGHAAIYKSTNFGTTWTLLNTGISFQGGVQRIKLAIAPSDNNYVYALCCDASSGFYGIYKSINAGTSWTYYLPQLNILEAGQGTGSGGQGAYDMALIVNKTDKNTIYTGGINLWGSTDGGINFDPISHWTLQYGATLHGDIHYIERQPITDNIFVCSDGGIYKTSNLQIGTWSTSWPTTWTNLSNGMQCTSFYRLSSSKNQKGRLIAGAQDNASFYNDGTGWATIFGGDGMDNYLDPINHQNILGSSQFGNLFYSNNNGAFGNFVGSNPNNESSEWVTPIVADYNHPGVLYAGNENVVKSIDGGQNWTALASVYTNTVTLANTEISALAVSPTNSQVIYAARRVRYEFGLKGIVFRTTNGGTSFTKITANLPDSLFYTGIEVSNTNQDEAVICMAGFSAGHKVYKTTNGGVNWVNISYNLPNIPVTCVKYIPGTSKIIVATDMGLYILDNATTTWNSYSSGLPNVIVSDIEFNPALNKTYVSTFGRGIWETSLSQMSGTVTNTIGLKHLDMPVQFNVYPAINKGKFSIQLEELGATPKLDIMDVNGRIVFSEVLSTILTEINLNLLPGAYFVRVLRYDKVGVRRILVE